MIHTLATIQMDHPTLATLLNHNGGRFMNEYLWPSELSELLHHVYHLRVGE